MNGTLYPAASLPPNYVPYATSGGVLPDGRVLLIGGEYKLLSNNTLTLFFTKQMAIYDPKADSWTMVAPPTGPEWDFIGDSPWTLLPNGKLLLGEKFSKAMAEFDPATMKWTEVSSFAKDDGFAEEGFSLLPDGSVLTVNMVDVNKAQRYISHSDTAKNRWDDAGATPGQLPAIGDTNNAKNLIYDNGKRVYHPTGEIGPGMLRPDGTVFWSGAACTIKGPSTDPNACVNYKPIAPTAVYHIDDQFLDGRPRPPLTWGPGGRGRGRYLVQPAAERECPGANQSARSHRRSGWSRQRSLREHPQRARRTSSPPKPKARQSTCPETSIWRLYEFDGTNLIPEPAASMCNNQPSLLLLPTGEVMLNLNFVYASTNGTFQNAWRPTITQFTQSLDNGGNYQIFGTQFNGLSHANAFGDEFQVNGNFPMVRITNNATGDVRYAHTYN